MPTTVYDVSTRYSLQATGAQDLQRLGAGADSAWASISRLGGLMAGGVAFAAGKRYLVDFNSEVEQAKISIAAISRMFGQSGSWGSAMEYSTGLFDRYQQAAKISTATTKEFLDMHLSLAASFAKAGVGGRVLEDIVQGAVVAAPILGERADTFAFDLKQMMQGGVGIRDRSANALLAMLGIEKEQFNQKVRQNVGYAVETIQKALTSPAIMEARKAQEKSFAGVTSTLVDTLEITMGKVGLPLFQRLTREVETWNTWIERNGATMERWTAQAADFLIRGFGAAKDATAFIVANGDTLIAIAKVWALAQGVSAVGGAASSIGGLVGGLGRVGGMLGGGGKLAMESALLSTTAEVGALGNAGVGAATRLASLAGPIGLTVAALGTFAAALEVGRRAPGGVYDRQESQRTIRDALDPAWMKIYGEEATKSAVFEWARTSGALNLEGDGEGLNRRAFMERLVQLGEKDGERITRMADMAERVLGAMSWEEWDKRLGRAAEAKAEDPVKKAGKLATGMNVTIHRIEVASDDPDRFVHQLTSALQRASRNPTSARSAIAGAF